MSDKITIKTIQARTGIAITGEFIVETLGVQPVEKEKRSVFWSESQYPEIVDKLVTHLERAKGNKTVAAKPEAKAKKTDKAEKSAGGGFDFGGKTETPAPAPAPAAASTGFDFGVKTETAAPAQAAASTGFDFGAAPAPAPAASGFNFG